MAAIELFFDSAALMAGVISGEGAARVLLLLTEAGKIIPVISMQVTFEVERALARKVPDAIPYYRQILKVANFKLVKDPDAELIRQNLHLIGHPADVSILLAAMQSKVQFLATLNRKHFLDDHSVAQKTGLKIGTPGDALLWVRKLLLS
jgi:predicted nucleic acid-binding protein